MFVLVENLPNLSYTDIDQLINLTQGLLTKYNQFANCSFVVQEVFLRCITCLWLQLKQLHYDSVKDLFLSTLKSVSNFSNSNTIGQSKYLESAVLFLFSICVKAKHDVSTVIFNVMKSNTNCKTIFEILGMVLSNNPVENGNSLEKLINYEYCDRKVLIDQIITNQKLIELVCQQCSIMNSLFDTKLWVLSNFSPALNMYFKNYESIDNFVSNLSSLRRDSEITQALNCINGHLCNLVSDNFTMFVYTFA